MNQYPKGFELFIDIARSVNDVSGFISKAQQIKNIPATTSEWFFDKYDRGRFDMNVAVHSFLVDVNSGVYD